MNTRFRPYHPGQSYLLPPSPSDWLAEGHLAYFIAEIVDTLDVGSFYARYEGDGRRNSPYDPRMLLKVLVYAYASGVFSSRKIAGKLGEDVAFRVLGAGNFPDHRTINRFRQEHVEEFAGIFEQVVKLAREMKLMRMGTLAIDGTKVRANASKHKAMSYGRMKGQEEKLKVEITELLRRAQQVDEAEDEKYGAEQRGDELPEELQRREDRLKKIQQAKQRLEQRQKEEDRAAGRKPDDGKWASRVRPQGGRSKHRREFGEVPEKKQENFTDPASRIMKTQDGFQQCYNGQIAVEGESRLIVANDVVQNAADNDCLVSMTEAARRNTKRKPQRVLADAGYRSEENFRKLAEARITAYVALGREGKSAKNILPCEENVHTQAMEDRMKSAQGQRWYRRRKAIAELPFGWIKHALGFRRFSLRGLKKVQGEWQLVCAALNLKRIAALTTA
ncbi:MAG: IS1182 family transposase [Pseudomonadota bacterium]